MTTETTQIENPEGFTLVDQPDSLSKSILWQLGEKYYQEEGPEAWGEGKIPYSITHHHSIVDYYADVIASLINDEPKEIINIIEIGSGTGHFAWRLLSALERRFPSDLTKDRLQYQLTDLVDANLRFAREHALLAPYFKRGIVTSCKLRIDQSQHHEFDRKAKVVVIANYAFDSTPHDIFYIDNGAINLCRPKLFAPNTAEAQTISHDPECFQLHYEKEPTTAQHYGEVDIDIVLKGLCERKGEGFISFPVTALRFLSNLRQSTDQIVLLASDLPSPEWDDPRTEELPSLSWRGGIWMAVDFNTIKLWFESQKGSCHINTVYYGKLSTAVGMTDASSVNESITNSSFSMFPADSWMAINEKFARTREQLTIKEILVWLRLCARDPVLMRTGLESLRVKISETTHEQCQELVLIAEITQQYHFSLPGGWDVFAAFAEVFFHSSFYEIALKYWKLSITRHGPTLENYFGMALTAAHLTDYLLTQQTIDKLLRIDSKYEPCLKLQEWLHEQDVSGSFPK